MDKALASLWAKTGKNGDASCHPLILHMLDVAASADAILAREPESTRKRMAAILGMEWEDARAWLLLVIACHDLGKACPGFQFKWPELLASTGLRLPRSPDTDIHHAFVNQIALTEMLQEMGWPDELAERVADAAGCHHGSRTSENAKAKAEAEIYVGKGGRLEAVRTDWMQVRRNLFEALLDVLKPARLPTKQVLNGPDFMLFSGLTSFADWIGSNEEWFPFGSPEDCGNPEKWFQRRRAYADKALNAIGWEPRTSLSPAPKTFQQVFRFPPRPLQQAVADALTDLQGPAILLVEAPMARARPRRFSSRGFAVSAIMGVSSDETTHRYSVGDEDRSAVHRNISRIEGTGRKKPDESPQRTFVSLLG